MSTDVGIIGYLEAGIRRETVHQSAIANNIANVNTPGYRRVDLKFDKVLAERIAQGRDIAADECEPEIFEPKSTPLSDQGNDVSIDSEVGDLIKNSVTHKTYMRLLAKKYQQISLAIDTAK